jgi:ATP-dependent Zn protease
VKPRGPTSVALRATAYHEAGHAVVAFWNHIRLYRVSLQAEGDELGAYLPGNLLNGRDIEWDT